MAISFPVLFFAAIDFPLYGVIICVLYALRTNQPTEATDCVGVPEFLPSISMVIGAEPQVKYWKTLITLTTPIRVGVAVLYLRHGTMRLSGVAFVFYLLELASLLVLSCVTSTENFPVHAAAFYAFSAFSSIAVALNSIHPNRTPFASWTDRVALLTKRTILGVYMVQLCTAYYLYTRHCRYCEPYSYSYFAMCEYTLVLSNTIYHSCALFDFWNWQLACRSDVFGGKWDRKRNGAGYSMLIEQNVSLAHDESTKV